ncbi:hypothetical protein RhiirC2_718276 [Rhizophagus irregularis]|uniref:Uncharacterized protein n=1 Tax=Rhizophagus irregularis TaxID=588596 RepID=A0A2N1MJ24_9GLOM|nr:hypothetical protein RhiirC2_718276 [Rhizophagus irregularis]
MFHPEYSYIADRLPISEKCDQIEDYLRHTLEIYQISLNWKRKTMRRNKALQLRSWPVDGDDALRISPLALLTIYVADNGTQTDPDCKTTHTYDVEINHWVMRELVNLQQRLLKYNRDTFSRFMQELTREYDERIKANQRLHHEIEDLKMQVITADISSSTLSPLMYVLAFISENKMSNTSGRVMFCSFVYIYREEFHLWHMLAHSYDVCPKVSSEKYTYMHTI